MHKRPGPNGLAYDWCTWEIRRCYLAHHKVGTPQIFTFELRDCSKKLTPLYYANFLSWLQWAGLKLNKRLGKCLNWQFETIQISPKFWQPFSKPKRPNIRIFSWSGPPIPGVFYNVYLKSFLIGGTKVQKMKHLNTSKCSTFKIIPKSEIFNKLFGITCHSTYKSTS